MIDNREKDETVILVAVSADDDRQTAEASLDELAELVKTAGAEVLGRAVQNREYADPSYYVGRGKLTQIQEILHETGATGIVCDDELSPAQISGLGEALDCKVMDRTMVILDIFAARASSAEGKVQVELAQQRYRLTHLAGLGTALSRLGGGIGTRGPGEKKLEMDRRYIRARISQLKKELDDIMRHRQVTRENRQRSGISKMAIIGYTNAGKSTLLNCLTDAQVLEEDKLFATLDPTTRQFRLDSGQEILLTDTVGFINKLPHNLIDAFKSTLEEAKYADYIIHVADASSPQLDEHISIVYDTLRELGIAGKKILTVFNKMDLAPDETHLRDERASYTVKVSLRDGTGVDELKKAMERMIRGDRVYLSKVIPYSQSSGLQIIRRYGELLSERYEDDGIHITAFVPPEISRHRG